MVNFSLIHLYPTFGIIGILCSYSLMVWLLEAISCAVRRWRALSFADIAMIVFAAIVTAAAVIPERFFA